MNKQEYIILVIDIAFLILGASYDSAGCSYIDKDFANTVIQIQATLATIGIAVLTLITTKIGHKIYNIDFSNYAINNRHRVFNQINVIISIVTFVVISILVLLAHKYGMVLGLFMSSVAMLLFEICQISIVFKGEKEHTEMIVEFLNDNIQKNQHLVYPYLMAPFEENIKDWTKFKVDNYVLISENLWRNYLENCKSQEAFSEYSDYLIKSIKGLLICERSDYKTVGLQYLQNIYKYYDGSQCRFEFTPYSYLQETIWGITKDLNEEGLRILSVYIPCQILYADDMSKLTAADKAAIGSYLSYVPNCFRKRNGKYKINAILQNSLINILHHVYFSQNVSNEYDTTNAIDILNKEVYDLQSSFFVSLVDNGYFSVIQKGFFDDFLKEGFYIRKSFNTVACVLSNILYLYYVAYHEEEKHLIGGIVTKNKSLELLKAKGEVIDNFVSRCYYDNYFTLEMLGLLKSDLEKFEKMAVNDAKFMISKGTVENFFVLHMAANSFGDRDLKEKLEPIIQKDCFSYYNRFVAKGRKNTVLEELKYILTNYNNVCEKKDLVDRLENKYDLLCRTISEIYAETELQTVKNEIDKLDVDTVVNDLEPDVILKINELLGKLGLLNTIRNNTARRITKKCCLLNLKTPAHFVDKENIINGFMHFLEYQLCVSIMSIIPQSILDTKNTIHCDTDMLAFLKVIPTKEILVGVNPFAYIRDYNLHHELKKILEQRGKLVVGEYGELLSLDSSKINITFDNIQINVCELNKEDIDDDLEFIDGKYYAVATNDIKLGYTKDEAVEYVSNKYRIVKIECDLHMDYVGDCIGSQVVVKKA